MAGLVEVEQEVVVNICRDNTQGDVEIYYDLPIQFPKKPTSRKILFHDKKKEDQRWVRQELPEDLKRIRSMEEWMEMLMLLNGYYSNKN